jgi:hypothetical protein
MRGRFREARAGGVAETKTDVVQSNPHLTGTLFA